MRFNGFNMASADRGRHLDERSCQSTKATSETQILSLLPNRVLSV